LKLKLWLEAIQFQSRFYYAITPYRQYLATMALTLDIYL